MKFKKIVKETRLPVMWAIDYRDFHTAIHGLIYGKNRRDVEEFYDRLKAIYDDKEISPEYQEIYYQDLWDEFYPRIQQIDEINFRDIGKLPSGKYGIIIDDVEYRLVNNVAIDLYEESIKRNNKMKFKKIVKESIKRNNKMKFKKIVKESIDIDEYRSWNRVIGRGTHTWQKGDIDKPTGPIARKVFYFKDDTPEVRDAIAEVNRKVPRVGGRLDPWSYAERDFIALGNTACEFVVGDSIVRGVTVSDADGNSDSCDFTDGGTKPGIPFCKEST